MYEASPDYSKSNTTDTDKADILPTQYYTTTHSYLYLYNPNDTIIDPDEKCSSVLCTVFIVLL